MAETVVKEPDKNLSVLDARRDALLVFAAAWGGFGALTAVVYVALLPAFELLDLGDRWEPFGGVWLLGLVYPAVIAAIHGFAPGFAAGLAYALAGPRVGPLAVCATGALAAPPLLHRAFVEHGSVIAAPGWWYVPSLMLCLTFLAVSIHLGARPSGALGTTLQRSEMHGLRPAKRFFVALPFLAAAGILVVVAARWFCPL